MPQLSPQEMAGASSEPTSSLAQSFTSLALPREVPLDDRLRQLMDARDKTGPEVADRHALEFLRDSFAKQAGTETIRNEIQKALDQKTGHLATCSFDGGPPTVCAVLEKNDRRPQVLFSAKYPNSEAFAHYDDVSNTVCLGLQYPSGDVDVDYAHELRHARGMMEYGARSRDAEHSPSRRDYYLKLGGGDLDRGILLSVLWGGQELRHYVAAVLEQSAGKLTPGALSRLPGGDWYNRAVSELADRGNAVGMTLKATPPADINREVLEGFKRFFQYHLAPGTAVTEREQSKVSKAITSSAERLFGQFLLFK